MDKLRHLLEHWLEHNQEHVNTYLQWAERAEGLKRPDISEILRRIATGTEKLNGLFKEAKEKI